MRALRVPTSNRSDTPWGMISLRSSSLWRPSSPISRTPATSTLLLGWVAPGLHTNSITLEKVEGLLLIRMRFEEPALNSPAAVGRACIWAEGVLIALYSSVVAVEGESGAGEEGAFAALRHQLGEEEGTASEFEPRGSARQRRLRRRGRWLLLLLLRPRPPSLLLRRMRSKGGGWGCF